MKFILFSLVAFSNVAMAKSFCTSNAGESLTQSLPSRNYDEKTMKVYYEIRSALVKQCHELQNSKQVLAADIPHKIALNCDKLAKDKLRGEAYNSFSANCYHGYDVASAYFAGLYEGKQNGYSEASKKGCVEKTAVSELSRASKAIENEISTSEELKKTSDK